MPNIADLSVPHETATPGGAVIVSTCLRRHQIGNATWLLWRDRCGTLNVGTWIELCLGTGPGTWQRITESDGLRRYDVPLDWLGIAREVDRDWRYRVWAWNEDRIG